MTEKIIYSPGKVAPATAQGGGAPLGSATDPRLFAEILAEAEAVQDYVELRGAHRAGSAPAAAPGTLREVMYDALQGGIQGTVKDTLRGFAGLLIRTPQRSRAAARAGKSRRGAN